MIIVILAVVGALVLLYRRAASRPRRHMFITFGVTLTSFSPRPDGTPDYDVVNAQGEISLPSLVSMLFGLRRKN